MVLATPSRHLFTVDEWRRLGEVGLFGDNRRIELAEGEVIEMSPIGPAHAAIVDYLNRLVSYQVGGPAIVAVQRPVRLSDISEPQPDLSLLRFRGDYYRSGHPGAEDVMLIVEVADTSLQYDRDRKAVLYARAGVPEYWVIDIAASRVMIFGSPGSDAYSQIRTAGPGDVLRPQLLPEVQVPVSAIFGLD